jgi:CHRD domain
LEVPEQSAGTAACRQPRRPPAAPLGTHPRHALGRPRTTVPKDVVSSGNRSAKRKIRRRRRRARLARRGELSELRRRHELPDESDGPEAHVLLADGTPTLTAAQLGSMTRGQAYVNVDATRNSLGEMRGRINRVS